MQVFKPMLRRCSNNSFAKEVGSDYIYKAGKPSVSGYEDAMKRIQTTPDTTIFIGDQIFTDIYGANRAGIRTYLVQPIHPKEEIQIVLKRCIWCCMNTLHSVLITAY